MSPTSRRVFATAVVLWLGNVTNIVAMSVRSLLAMTHKSELWMVFGGF